MARILRPSRRPWVALVLQRVDKQVTKVSRRCPGNRLAIGELRENHYGPTEDRALWLVAIANYV